MTKQEIETLIDAKIARQGSAIDAGSALPTILKGILELASNPIAPEPKLTVAGWPLLHEVPLEEALQEMELTEEEFMSLPQQLLVRVRENVLTRGYVFEDISGWGVIFGGALSGDSGYICSISYDKNQRLVEANYLEI